MIYIDKEYIADDQYFWLDNIPDVKIGDQVILEKIHGMRNGA